MKNETPFEFPAWYINFQTAVLKQLPRPGEIDQTTAFGWERNQKSLKRNLAEVLLPPKPKVLKLQPSRIIVPSLTSIFDPIEKFGKNSRASYLLGDMFKKYLFDDIKPFSNLEEVFIDKSVLTEECNDHEIMVEIYEKDDKGLFSREVILHCLSYLTELQPEGEDGILSVNNITILGYFKCEDKNIRVATVQWNHLDHLWNCRAHEIDKKNWKIDTEVLF